MLSPYLSFTARTLQGSSRGQARGVPTINVRMDDVPDEMEEGIYACFVSIEHKRYPGALHYGPRPVHGDLPSCEVHVIGEQLELLPETADIELVQKLRDVRDFPSEAELYDQIASDIAQARAILAS